VLVACSWWARSASMTAARARSSVRPRGEHARRRGGLAVPRRPPRQSGLKQALHGLGMSGLRQVSVEASLMGMALVLGQPIAGPAAAVVGVTLLGSGAASAGRLTVKMLPVPGPALCACTVPP